MKNLYTKILTLLSIFILLSSCSQTDKTSELNRHGGSVRIAFKSKIKDLFPFTTDEYNVEQIHKFLISPSFVRFDKTGSAIPGIAEIWKTDQANLSITFVLNQKFKWSNGNPVQVSDIEYTLHLLNKFPKFDAVDLVNKNIKSFEKIDNKSCKITFNNAVAEPSYFTNFPIFPALNNYDTTDFEHFKKSYLNNFIGCGPFIISEVTTDSLILIRNNFYPDHLPYLNKVVFKIVDNFEQLKKEIISGKIDFVQNIPVELLADQSILKNNKIDTYPEKGYTFIAWNLNNEILSDKRMRMALSYSIDRQTLIDGILAGYAQIINGPVYQNYGDENNNLNHPKFNTTKAESLFVLMGWKDFDSEGFRTKNGRQLTIQMIVNRENMERVDIAKNIKSNLKSIGVNLQLNYVSWKELLNSIDHKISDAVLLTWIDNDYYDPTLLFHSKGIKNGINFMSYKSERVDSLMELALYSWDKKRRNTYWNEFREQVVADLPCTFLFSQKIIVAYNKKIKNIQLDSRGFLINVKEWWID